MPLLMEMTMGSRKGFSDSETMISCRSCRLGRATPTIAAMWRDHGPAQLITSGLAMGPRSVTTPVMRPSTLVTDSRAVRMKICTPRRRQARA